MAADPNIMMLMIGPVPANPNHAHLGRMANHLHPRRRRGFMNDHDLLLHRGLMLHDYRVRRRRLFPDHDHFFTVVVMATR